MIFKAKFRACSLIVGLLLLLGLCFCIELAQADNNADDETTPTAANSASPASTIATPTPAPSSPVPSSSSTQKPSGKKGNPKAGRICPKGCNCDEEVRKLTCTGDQFKTLQDLASLTNLTSIDIRGSAMESVDLTSLSSSKDSLESLDLSNNMIKSFQPPTKKSGDSFSKLRSLSLARNRLTNLSKLSTWKFPSLETLDLSGNLDLSEINQYDFNNTKGLQTLNMQNLKLKAIHELAFNPLNQLRVLNMTGVRLENHLGDKQFIGNQKLDTVDLSDNDLIEVPFALRSTSGITKLILNMNSMQSLRQSDFINRTKLVDLEIRRCPNLTKIDDLTFSDLIALKRLIITDNPNLSSISKDCFKSKSTANHTLDLFDIRDNNLTSLLDFASLEIKQLLLSGNPWHCDCNLLWFQSKFNAQTRPSAHCKTPDQFRDMEIGEFVSTLDCDQADSAMRTVVVFGFFLFLFILTVAVFVQKSEICRRFLWRDQYGTIYYTKASFPPETI